MELIDRRHWFTDKSTSGIWIIDGTRWCFTLEDVARPDGVKVQDKTCIPPGRYPVTIDFSNRFQRMMPLVKDVPMFSGVRIHAGNTDANTSGCILVGYKRMPDRIWESAKAFDDIFAKIKEAHERLEPIWLTVENAPL